MATNPSLYNGSRVNRHVAMRPGLSRHRTPDQPFGRYLLRDLLGQGGMGEVYRAFDTATRREVALKLLPEHAADDPINRRRFEREAYSAAALSEPHIVPIFDFGAVGSRLYLAMQLVDGTEVGTLLAGGRAFSPSVAVSVIEQIASALDAAHEANVVHRDVKPSNILVTKRNFAYLIDFGIARLMDASQLTSTGRTVGTLAYMAPERFRGAPTGAASDIYSLACVLHECLTGARPYAGTSAASQLSGHLNSPPPRPSQLRSGVPAGLDFVIARGMSKNPADRYATAGALAAAARRAISAPATAPRTPPSPVPAHAAPARSHRDPVSPPRPAPPRVAAQRVAAPRVAAPRVAAPRVAAPRVAAPRVAAQTHAPARPVPPRPDRAAAATPARSKRRRRSVGKLIFFGLITIAALAVLLTAGTYGMTQFTSRITVGGSAQSLSQELSDTAVSRPSWQGTTQL